MRTVPKRLRRLLKKRSLELCDILGLKTEKKEEILDADIEKL